MIDISNNQVVTRKYTSQQEMGNDLKFLVDNGYEIVYVMPQSLTAQFKKPI